MKCPACGRVMLVSGMSAQCPNILCDYEEDIEVGKLFDPRQETPAVVVINLEPASC